MARYKSSPVCSPSFFDLNVSEHWTDIGLPQGETRDAMLSTNNWTERAFKTFNQVFLGNRNNKS
jgi:hypothetical protein